MKALKPKVIIPVFIGIVLVLAVLVYVVLYYSGIASSDISEFWSDLRNKKFEKYRSIVRGKDRCIIDPFIIPEKIYPVETKEAIEECLEKYKNEPDELLPFEAVNINIHKAGDVDSAYQIPDMPFSESLSAYYSFYHISALGDPPTFEKNEKIYIFHRKDKSKYMIDITRAEHEEIYRKLTAEGFFELDNLFSCFLFLYFLDPEGEKNWPEVKTPYKPLWAKDFTELSCELISAIDDTPKNKAFIDKFVKWFKDKYDSRLYANPCKNNLFPDEYDYSTTIVK